ncbi:MAG: HAMP domain-containing histidine kinase [Planctomycetes bacterium]|nr:HAMP domain-containing histidine kinase [Planctomycetota bacterium]
MRAWHAWTIFSICAAALLAAMSWVSWAVLGLEQAEIEAQQRAAIEERVRLALWRMDSSLSPFIAQESARPYFTYSAFYPAEGAYTRMFARIEKGEVLVPSPLLTFSSPQVRIHFQFAAGGQLSSPQAPAGNMRDLAESGYTTHEAIEDAHRLLEELADLVRPEELARRLEEAGDPAPGALDGGAASSQLAGSGAPPERAGQQPPRPLEPPPQEEEEQQQQELQPQQRQQAAASSVQQILNRAEMAARAKNILQQAEESQIASTWHKAPSASIDEQGMKPLWIGGALLLARRVRVNGGTYLQGCWIDWEELTERLLESIRDLLPDAQLEPCDAGQADGEERRLAALPVRLLPRFESRIAPALLTPLRISLATAWICGIAAAGALVILLRGVMALSERRRVFVSAVTHELRTPLTTFRMYTEMLAAGMVEGEEKKRGYLERLAGEAERLGHLVENVLAYARLESRRTEAVRDRIDLVQWMERLRDRLAECAERCGMELAVRLPEAVRARGEGDGEKSEDGDGGERGGERGAHRRDDGGRRAEIAVSLDTSALEQILVNLVDNACKYAGRAEDRRIHLELERAPGRAVIRVRDHGPGISRRDRRRLFQLFSKSDRDAANSAPGVGLGLALSRRLARALGGDLYLDPDVDDGAAFVVEVPAE